jgi:hypothetical protein
MEHYARVVVDRPEVSPGRLGYPIHTQRLDRAPPADNRALAPVTSQGDVLHQTPASQLHDYYTAQAKPSTKPAWLCTMTDTPLGNFLLLTLGLSLAFMYIKK